MNQELTRLHLLRHGEVEERYHRVFGGRIDMSLSPAGLNQAQTLARYLHKLPIQAVYSSPMKRVQQTVQPYLSLRGGEPTVMPDLREVDFGDWTGLGWQEVRDQFGRSPFDWLDHLENGEIPNAENTEMYRGRIQPCLRHILAEHPGEQVAVFCHGGVVRQLLALLLELPLRKMSMFEVDYASVTTVDWRPGRVEIQLLNFAPWKQSP